MRFWIDVSEPGGLDPVPRGRATGMRVRVMHVFIRRRLLRHTEWDSAAWGMPISIGDATMTLIGGATIPGLALWSAGHQTTITEIEALLHFWRYIGHLLGVQPDFYPRNFRESVQLTYAYMVKRAYGAGDDGRELVESCLPAFEPVPGSPLRKRLRDEFNYRNPDRLHPPLVTAGHLPPARHAVPLALGAAPGASVPGRVRLETCRRLFPPLDHAADRVQRWRRSRWYENETGGREAAFKPVEEFRR